MNNAALTDKELILAIIYTFIAFVLMTIAVVVFVYYSRKKIIQKEIENKDMEIKYQKEIINATILAQEEERSRIARDLHDDISSKLNIISLSSYMLNSENLSDEEQKEITANIVNVCGKVLQSTRRISYDLLPPVLENFGLNVAIEELCNNFSVANKVQINYKNTLKQSIFEDIPLHNHLHLYRILQELINNSIRHGNARQIDIRFAIEDGKKICEYVDDGKGFDIKNTKYRRGLGIKNIESRTSFLKGDLKIESAISQGVRVILNF
ncbi:histidine kinase [Flavobacterium sp. NRK F10]|uniref:histidine kinase n=1 Tax=Flavobacterium sediminis TaxID=2201181 RepID=A0A2U8QSG9_9FLAO|nr:MULTISPECIES: histidine kinase [Flavobacterium]AWM12795.1 two-component sensor histidine kinase [Flavobacterium sediminis]MCO6173921.1 histidine kinase [Flavobacterium sp. NRK F10]